MIYNTGTNKKRDERMYFRGELKKRRAKTEEKTVNIKNIPQTNSNPLSKEKKNKSCVFCSAVCFDFFFVFNKYHFGSLQQTFINHPRILHIYSCVNYTKRKRKERANKKFRLITVQ